MVTKDTAAATSNQTSGDETPRPRQLFLSLRANGDGTGLASEILEGHASLGRLFRRQFKKAFHILVVKRGIRDKLGLYDDIRHRARQLIGMHLSNSCGSRYQDQGDSDFEGYIYVLCRRNIEFARLQEIKQRAKDDEKMQQLVSELDPADVSAASHDVDVCRAFEIAERVIAALDDTRVKIAMVDLMGDIPVAKTAERLGCSRRMVQFYRKQGIDLVKAAWEGDIIQ